MGGWDRALILPEVWGVAGQWVPAELSLWGILRGGRGRRAGGLSSIGCNMGEGPFPPTTEGMRNLDPWWCWIIWGILELELWLDRRDSRVGKGSWTMAHASLVRGRREEGEQDTAAGGSVLPTAQIAIREVTPSLQLLPYTACPSFSFSSHTFKLLPCFPFKWFKVYFVLTVDSIGCLLNCFRLIYLLLGFLTIFISPLLKSLLYVYSLIYKLLASSHILKIISFLLKKSSL